MGDFSQMMVMPACIECGAYSDYEHKFPCKRIGDSNKQPVWCTCLVPMPNAHDATCVLAMSRKRT